MKGIAQVLAKQGRNGDSTLVHMAPGEVQALRGIAALHGTKLTTNPETGLPEAFSLKSVLPMVAGAAANYFLPGSSFLIPALAGAATGAVTGGGMKGALTGALGGVGGAGIGSMLAGGMGAGAAPSIFASETAAPVADAMMTPVLDAGSAAMGAMGSTGAYMPSLAASQAMPAAAAQQSLASLMNPAYANPALAQAANSANLAMPVSTGLGASTPAVGMLPTGPIVPPGGTPQPKGIAEWLFNKDTWQTADGKPTFAAQAALGLGSMGANMMGTRAMIAARNKAIQDQRDYIQGLQASKPWRAAQGGVASIYPNRRPEREVINAGSGPEVDPFTGQTMAGGGRPGHPRFLKGGGDGMSDSIPAQIDGQKPAALANEEFVIPADVVSHLGNGSSSAGAKVLYDMMDRVRHARTGSKKQGKQIKATKLVPA